MQRMLLLDGRRRVMNLDEMKQIYLYGSTSIYKKETSIYASEDK